MVGATEHDRQTIAAWIFGKIFVGHGRVLLRPLFRSESFERLSELPSQLAALEGVTRVLYIAITVALLVSRIRTEPSDSPHLNRHDPEYQP
jgi:hypothetical protein